MGKYRIQECSSLFSMLTDTKEKTWFLEEDLGEFMGWRDIEYVDAETKDEARKLLKEKLCRIVDEAE